MNAVEPLEAVPSLKWFRLGSQFYVTRRLMVTLVSRPVTVARVKWNILVSMCDRHEQCWH